MSRLGKKPIKIPEGIRITVKDKEIEIKKESKLINFDIPKKIEAKVEDEKIFLSSPIKRKADRATYGLTRATLANTIKGMDKDFKKILEFNGVGYSATIEGTNLKLNLGFSNPIILSIPKDVKVIVEKNNIIVTGEDKQKVGQFAATIRVQRKVEPYKGKGIKYKKEIVRRKAGKTALKGEGEGSE